MPEKKDENQKGCSSCGEEKTLLTEDLYAVPRCAGCGKPRGPVVNTTKP